MEQTDLHWTAPEFMPRPKTSGWYWRSMVVAILILAFSVWQKNFLFSFFVVLAEVLLIVWGNREPREFEFTLGPSGLQIGSRKLYPYTEMSGFALLPGRVPEWQELVLHLEHRLNPFVKVAVPTDQVDTIKTFLSGKLQVMEYQDSFLDILENLLGF